MEIKVTGDVERIVSIMLADASMDKKVMAAKLGVAPSTFYSALSKQSLRLVDFMRVADELGYEITARRKEGETK